MEGGGGTSGMLWAVKLGELCGNAGRGREAERTFLTSWLDLAGAQAGFLGLRSSHGENVQVTSGFDGLRFDGLWRGPFPRAAADQLARGEAVALHEQGEADDWWPRPDAGDEPLRRLLSVVVGEAGQLRAVLVAGWTSEAGGANGLLDATRLLLEPLQRALRRLAEPRRNDDRPAWERSRVPLIFLLDDGSVAEVNPAARRKLGISGTDPELPGWLGETVSARIRLVRETGTGLGEVTGEHTYLGVSDGRNDFRVGIAPVMNEDGSEPSWLLTVEKGGPSLWERVEQAEDSLGLTPRESLVLELLARGMSNRQIGEVASVKEATVKYHLFSVMRKSGTANRTELLASFYAGDLSAESEPDDESIEQRSESVDLGFATITWEVGGLVRVVLADQTDLTEQRAQLLWNEFESRFDRPVKLFADIGGLRSVSPEVQAFLGQRAGQRVRVCAICAAAGIGRAAATGYLTEGRPPYPIRIFKSEDEAVAWLASQD
jgi:DNA-binding CsgD family transcriptional regulator